MKIKNIKIYIVLIMALLGVCNYSYAQIGINVGSVPMDIADETPFLDASTYFSIGAAGNDAGKGLAFPSTDLTKFQFILNMGRYGIDFQTYFDGMIVYNSGTGYTSTKQVNKSTYVTPGFYYFSNPDGIVEYDIRYGEWLRLTNNIDLLAKTVSVSAEAPTDPAPQDGWVYFNTDENTMYRYDGSAWNAVSSMASAADSGAGNPTTGGDETSGDMYVNETDNTVWVYNGSEWTEMLTKVYTDGETLEGTGTQGSTLKVKNGGITPVKLAGISGNGTNGQVLTSTGDGEFAWKNAADIGGGSGVTTGTTTPTDGSGTEGETYYNNTTDTYYVYGSDDKWHEVGGGTTTADIAPSTDKNYVTDDQLTNITNLSGTNSGDVSLAGQSYLSLSGQTITANAIEASHLKGSSGALAADAATLNMVLQSNGNGSFSWLDLTEGITVSADAENLTLPQGQLFVGGTGNTAEATAKTAIPISGFGAATADVAMGSKKITALADPTNAQEAATKNYVDTQVSASAGMTAVVSNATLTGDGTSGSPLGIASGSITLGSLDNIGMSKLLGRNSATAGKPEEISLGTGLSMSSSGTLSVASQLTYTALATAATLSTPISSTPVTIAGATASAAGLMSAADKDKLDKLDQNYSLPIATATTLGGIKVGDNLSITGGVLSANVGGSGTVTTVSVATNDGVSGSVTNPTTTPAIKLELGDITPTSISTGTISSGAITSTGNITTTGDLTVDDLIVNGSISGSIESAVNVTGIVGIANGGTGANTVAGALSNLGLNNVNNTSDANKPISTATQAALDLMIPKAQKGVASGVVPLNASKKIDEEYLPASLAGGASFQGAYDAAANSPTLAAASSANTGFYYIASTAGTIYSLTLAVGDWLISDGSNWSKISGGSNVGSVFGRTGTITAESGDYDTDKVTEGSTNLYYTDARVDARLTGKQDVSNLSNAIATDATSTTKYPSVNAIKTYVDAKVPSSSTADNGKVLTVTAGVPGWETPSGGTITLTGAVTGSGSGSITTSLSNNAVTSAKIADATIVAADIANQTITATKLAGITANGTLGQALLSNGNGTFYWGSGGGGSATNLDYTQAAAEGTVTSDTGNNATIPAVTDAYAGLMLPAHKEELDNIADISGSATDAGKVLTLNSTGTAATWKTPAAGGGGGAASYAKIEIGSASDAMIYVVAKGWGNLDDITVTVEDKIGVGFNGLYITIPTETTLDFLQVTIPASSTAHLTAIEGTVEMLVVQLKDTDKRFNNSLNDMLIPQFRYWVLSKKTPDNMGSNSYYSGYTEVAAETLLGFGNENEGIVNFGYSIGDFATATSQGKAGFSITYKF